MQPFLVIELDVSGQSRIEFRNNSVVLEVDVFVLDGAPETFNEDVVQSTTTEFMLIWISAFSR